MVSTNDPAPDFTAPLANGDVGEADDATMSFEDLGIDEVAQRAVFVVDGGGTVTYAWASENPGVEPEYDAVEAAVRDG